MVVPVSVSLSSLVIVNYLSGGGASHVLLSLSSPPPCACKCVHECVGVCLLVWAHVSGAEDGVFLNPLPFCFQIVSHWT